MTETENNGTTTSAVATIAPELAVLEKLSIAARKSYGNYGLEQFARQSSPFRAGKDSADTVGVLLGG